VLLEARLIDDLLDLARIRNGKLRIEPRLVEIHEILRHALEICRPELATRHLRIVEDLQARETKVRGDPARLQQVFWNLLTNAAKFSPEGLSIKVRSFGESSVARVGVEITDEGVGIEPEKLPRIFNAFEQDARHGQTGLGLGLAICKALVEMHGGEIVAQSAGKNSGATFTVYLPCASSIDAPDAAPRQEVSSRAGVRLLLVEDHSDTLNTLERLLTRRGFVVRTAGSVAEALRVANEYEFDVLVSDIGLPDGRGTELLDQLEAKRGERLPAIAMSGFGMEDDLESSRAAGFSEHLTKPVEFAALQQAIAGLVAQMPDEANTGR
jgi:CheY-like chemotaxis protein